MRGSKQFFQFSSDFNFLYCRYLHEVCLPSVVHRNLKTANILLDEDLNPHLSDCGLAALTPNTERQVNTQRILFLSELGNGCLCPKHVFHDGYGLISNQMYCINDSSRFLLRWLVHLVIVLQNLPCQEYTPSRVTCTALGW